MRDHKPPGLAIVDDPEPLTIHHAIVDLAGDPVIGDHRGEGGPRDIIPTCKRIEDHYDNLVGLSIARGFTHKIRELFGGPRGCTHTTALLQAMAPVAIQSIWSVNTGQTRSGDGDSPYSNEDERKRALIANTNTCHVWAEDGEQVAGRETAGRWTCRCRITPAVRRARATRPAGVADLQDLARQLRGLHCGRGRPPADL